MTFLSVIDLRRLSEGTCVCADALAMNAKNATNRLAQRNMFTPQLADLRLPRNFIRFMPCGQLSDFRFLSGSRARGFVFDRIALQDHTANNADAEHIEPTVHEIEQVRAHQRRDSVLDHDDSTDPGGEARYAKQKIVCNPHRQQHDRADQAQLDRHRENLAVRIDGGYSGRPRLTDRRAAEFAGNRTGAVANPGRRADEADGFPQKLDVIANVVVFTRLTISVNVGSARAEPSAQVIRAPPR